MNLIDGEIVYEKIDDDMLLHIKNEVVSTLNTKQLDVMKLIDACDGVVNNLDLADYESFLAESGMNEDLAIGYFKQAKNLFSKDALMHRLKKEIGENLFTPYRISENIYEQVCPLGVLLHIPAGNTDALPAYSVIEGLLCGNINLLKLPSSIDNGLTIYILQMIIREYPLLAKYIYVLDYSSQDVFIMQNLISIAQAIVVWGGTEAVSVLRSITPPEVKIIEWGHKISFAYVSSRSLFSPELEKVAKNIVLTNQLLCSSCQGIYLDVEDTSQIYSFCEYFLPILDRVSREYSLNQDIDISAQVTCWKLTQRYSQSQNNAKLFETENVSLIAYKDSKLSDTIKFQNAWVRPLIHTEIVKTLYEYKNLLQSVALICEEDEKEELISSFIHSGLTRILINEDLSSTYLGEPHDGEFSLRRYTKIVSIG